MNARTRASIVLWGMCLVVASGNNPIWCETVTRSASGATGWCRTNTPTLLNLSIITAGLTLNAAGTTAPLNTPVMLFAREPTQ